MALKMLLVKVALSDIDFVLGVTEATCPGVAAARAQQAEQLNTHLLRDLPVTQGQLAEMWNFISVNMPSTPARNGEQRDERGTGGSGSGSVSLGVSSHPSRVCRSTDV